MRLFFRTAVLPLILSCLIVPVSSAQNTFGAGLVGGVNAAQILGDNLAGYDKLGLRAGVRGIIFIDDQSEISIDILYSQRGARTELIPGNIGLNLQIRTDYIEVPIMYHLKDWLEETEDFYKVRAFGGLSFGRLFSADAFEFPGIEPEVENFNEFDISWVLGAGYQVSPNFLLTGSYTRSFNRLYNNRRFLAANGLPRYNEPLTGFFLTFQGIYLF